jgi:elongation factor P hydroxylase
MTAAELVRALNPYLQERWNTRLAGGFPEPLYTPPSPDGPGEIRFARDSIASALHELAHWCIAGKERLEIIDYGYWYRPDGRNAEEQAEFFRVEVKPQALEKAFSEICGISFEVSCDNLGGGATDSTEFDHAVCLQFEEYKKRGLPPRAQEIANELLAFRLRRQLGPSVVEA